MSNKITITNCTNSNTMFNQLQYPTEEHTISHQVQKLEKKIRLYISCGSKLHQGLPFSDSSDDEDGEEFARVIERDYSSLRNGMFKEHFRMRKDTFQILLDIIGNALENPNDLPGKEKMPLSKQLLITLWILATPDSFRSVAERFQPCSKGTAHFVYLKMLTAIKGLANNFIRWPRADELNDISTAFMERTGYPNVAGAIDGVHLPIKAPIEHPARYFDKDHNHSIKMIAVCDHNMLFRDVYIGEVGSVHDARAFRRSPLSAALNEQREATLGLNHHLLGDNAFPISVTMMIPYRDNGHLNNIQIRHNKMLSAGRCIIERSFALLKGKWRRLKYQDVTCIENAVDNTLVSCILHNHCLMEEGIHEDEEQEIENLNLHDEPEENIAANFQNNGRQMLGELKRNRIAANL